MLRTIIYLILVMVVLSGVSSAQTAAATGQGDKTKAAGGKPSSIPGTRLSMIEGKVITVTDGDNISVESKDKNVYSIRLQGIDAPEEKQNYGKKARKSLSNLILGKDVKVIVHRKDQDKYVGSVYLGGQDVAYKQLESGMAWYYKVYGQTAEERKRYAQAELNARTAKAGLWEDSTPTAPWDYRDGKKATTSDPPKDTVEAASATIQTTPKTDASGRTYILGPRGGCYYINASGKKNYVDKAKCN